MLQLAKYETPTQRFKSQPTRCAKRRNDDFNVQVQTECVESHLKKPKIEQPKYETQQCNLNDLPDEMFYMGILSYLEFEYLTGCALVCKKWFKTVGQTATSIHHDTIVKKLKNTNNYCVFVASACRYFKNIHELTLHDCGMITMFNERDNGYLETALGNLNNIRKLEIHGLRVTDHACLEFSNKPKPFLTELRLDLCMISDYGFATLARNNTLENVSILSATTNALDVDSCKEISNLKHLKYVDLSNNSIDKMGAQYLGKSMTNVEFLDLSFNMIEEGFEFLCSKRSSMKKLVITGNNIPGAALKNIENLENLVYLDMSNNPLGHEGASFLSKGLMNVTTLKLSDAKINSPAMIYFSEGRMNKVTDLSLEGNFFGDDGCLVFQSPMFSNLKKLKLNRNCITCFGCEHLACENLKYLEELNLSFNRIKARGLHYLSNGKFENLETLNLSSNYIPDQASSLFKKNTFSKLTVLFLMGNRMTNLSYDSIRSFIPSMKLSDF